MLSRVFYSPFKRLWPIWRDDEHIDPPERLWMPSDVTAAILRAEGCKTCWSWDAVQVCRRKQLPCTLSSNVFALRIGKHENRSTLINWRPGQRDSWHFIDSSVSLQEEELQLHISKQAQCSSSRRVKKKWHKAENQSLQLWLCPYTKWRRAA